MYRQSIAIRLLGLLGPTGVTPQVREALLQIARGQDNPILRSSALGALGKFGPAIADEEICRVLVKALSSTENVDLRSTAAEAVARLGSAPVLYPAVKALYQMHIPQEAQMLRMTWG